MARNYYTGVPIGGTIMWAGSIIGLEIPANFTENYKLANYTDERLSPFIVASSLPSEEGYLLRGYNAIAFTKTMVYTADNTVKLILDNMPIVSLVKDNIDFPDFTYSAAEVSSLFNIANNTTSSVLTNSATSSTARATSSETDYATRYAPYDNHYFGWDHSGWLSGSGSGKYPYRTSKSSALETGAHSHSTKTDTHSHSISLSFTSDWDNQGDVMFNNNSQTSLSYAIKTKSVGIQLITRMY